MAKIESRLAVQADANSVPQPATRAPWTSPRIVVSDLADARAMVSNGADGSTSGYAYGS